MFGLDRYYGREYIGDPHLTKDPKTDNEILASDIIEDRIEEFYPLYDISEDKRYFYIPARNDREYTNAETFKREKVKLNGGLYIYDWWENKLFMLAEENVVDVTNNTEDGYVYYKIMKREDRKRVYEYYWFRNPEEVLKIFD